MDYEKAYKEALERAKAIYQDKDIPGRPGKATAIAEIIPKVFPELAETEEERDERVRKELLAVVNYLVLPGDQQARFVTWLKKQEQNRTWSEDDERMLDKIIEDLTPYGECPDDPSPMDLDYYEGRSKIIDWLKKKLQH